MDIRIGKQLRILGTVLLCGAVLSGCKASRTGPEAEENQGKSRAVLQADELAGWDHIAMEASEDISAEVLKADTEILTKRLASFAGEGRCLMEVSGEGSRNPGPRIDIYMDPLLKGTEDLSYIARTRISGPLRFALYSSESGFLDLEEDQFLDLSPEDVVRAEMTGTDAAEPGFTIVLSDAFLDRNAQQLEAWQDTLILIADIRDITSREWLSGSVVDTWTLQKTEDPGIWMVDPSSLTKSQAEYLAEKLPEAPLSGTYFTVCQSGTEWDGMELLPEAEGDEAGPESSGSQLCSREELESSGSETVMISMRQSDRAMDDESRRQLLSGLCSRMDALGMPYCLGEQAGQMGTVVIETLPDHINEDVISILQGAAPLYLTANVYDLHLIGGLCEASVIALPDGTFALDLSLTEGGRDSLYRMSRAQEELGGGEVCLCLQRYSPISGTWIESTIADGHILFDRNYTGIGGDSWDAENRWVLDLVCAVLNTEAYPQQQEGGLVEGSGSGRIFAHPEYCLRDPDGLLHPPETAGFTDAESAEETLEKLRAFAPDAEITDCTEYGEYTICLNLDPPDAEGEAGEAYLADVYQLLLAGPMKNADVYLTGVDTDYISFRTCFDGETVKISEGFAISEEYYSLVMARAYTGHPALQLLDRSMKRALQSMRETIRR